MFELSGWVLFGAVAIWFFMLYRHSHSKRLHLNCYIIFLLLHDEFRAKQKQDLEVWLRENSASNALALLARGLYGHRGTGRSSSSR